LSIYPSSFILYSSPLNSERKVLKNSFAGLIALGAGSFLNLLTVSLLARYLGTAGFGQYSYIMAFVGAFQLCSEMGLSTVLVRDITLDKKNVNKYMGEALPLLWTLALGTLALIFLSARILHPDPELLTSLYIAGIATVVTTQPNIYIAVFRAFESMEINAIAFILQKVFFLALIYLIAIRGQQQLPGVFLALLGANLLVWFFYYLIAIQKYGRPKPRINVKYCVSLLKEAIPVGFGEISRKIIWQVDILILGIIDLPVSIALYSSAYKLLGALNLIPQVFAIPLYPYLSQLAENSPEALARAYEKSLKFMWILSLPIAIGTVVLSDRIIFAFFWTQYSGAAAALKILIWATMFLFLSSNYKYLFTILRKQHLYTYLVVLSLTVNTLLDLILIPLLSYKGACFATLITEVILYLVGYYFLRKSGVVVPLIPNAAKPLLGGVIAGMILYSVRDVSYGLLGLIGFMDFGFYFLLLFLFRTFSQKEIEGLVRLVKKS